MKMKEGTQKREEGRELHMEEFIAFVKSHAFFSIIFIIYKYLKCNYKHVNFLETTRYFWWVLFSVNMYNTKKSSLQCSQKFTFKIPSFIVQWNIALAAAFPNPFNKNLSEHLR